MAFGMTVYRGHLISRSDERHPKNGKRLYSISELKTATEPPLLVTQLECVAYIKEKDPWDKSLRIDPYGFRAGSKKKADWFRTKELRLAGEEVDPGLGTHET